LTVPQRI